MGASQAPRTLTFSILGTGHSRTGVIKNGNATLGDVAPHAARSLGLVGGFECLRPAAQGTEVLSPEIRLKDLPGDEVYLASEHTPANGRAGR